MGRVLWPGGRRRRGGARGSGVGGDICVCVLEVGWMGLGRGGEEVYIWGSRTLMV